MSLKDMDSGYKYRAVGVALLLLGFVSGIISLKTNVTVYNLLFLVFFFGGILLLEYGFTRIEVKHDVRYQKNIRRANKINLILFSLLLIVYFAAIFFAIIGMYTIVILLISIAIITYLILRINLYFLRKYALDYMKKLPESEKTKVKLIWVAVVIIALLLWYVANFIVFKK